MTKDQIALARALTRIPNWTWEPGMRIGAPARLGIIKPGMDTPWEWARLGSHDEIDGMTTEQVGQAAVPDIMDPGTGGVLMAKIPRDEIMDLTPLGDGVWLLTLCDRGSMSGDSLGEVAAVALLTLAGMEIP